MGLVSILLALSFAPFMKTLFVDFIISLVVGSVSLGIFVRFQKCTANPLVDLKVMSHRVIVFGNIALFATDLLSWFYRHS